MKIYCPMACGKCCKVLVITNHSKIPYSKQWIMSKDKASKFFLIHLKKITRKQAIKTNPEIFHLHSWKGINYFICDQFNYQTNKCDGYKSYRPPMCTGFPFYENSVLDASRLDHLPNCYYVNQVMRIIP